MATVADGQTTLSLMIILFVHYSSNYHLTKERTWGFYSFKIICCSKQWKTRLTAINIRPELRAWQRCTEHFHIASFYSMLKTTQTWVGYLLGKKSLLCPHPVWPWFAICLHPHLAGHSQAPIFSFSIFFFPT